MALALLTLLSEQSEIRSMYVEMNGFDINYDRWFCSPFGFSKVIDGKNPDELADFQAELHFREDLTLTGMEAMQEAYRWWSDNYSDHPEAEDSESIANLLVQTRFLSLIRAGVNHGPISPSVPVAAAAHDSDLISVTAPAT